MENNSETPTTSGRMLLEGPNEIELGSNIYWEIVTTKVGPKSAVYRAYEYQGEQRRSYHFTRSELELQSRGLCAAAKWFADNEEAAADAA